MGRKRSWSDLRDWAKKTRVGVGVLQNMLAWLSLNGCVSSDAAGKWSATGAPIPEALVGIPPQEVDSLMLLDDAGDDDENLLD